MKRRSLVPAVKFALLPASLIATTALAAESPSDSPVARQPQLEEMLIIGLRENRTSQGATGLVLDIKETPQSISLVTQEQMERYGANNLNDALRLTTGIQVDEWETNRTTFSARGFDIKNTQIDGVGLPNNWGIVTGAMDSAGYERLEVIRGANGLLTGVGNASGTINYVRKRPTNEPRGAIDISYGSWSTKRLELDYSTPFTTSGAWAGRVVVAHEEGDSWLRDKEDQRSFFYGVIDGQIGDNGSLAVGYSYQNAETDGNMWGALAFMYSDGRQAEWSRKASTTQDWTYWDTVTETAFIDYTHQYSPDWQLKASYNYRGIENDDRLFYATDLVGVGLDPATGTGLYGYPWGGDDESDAHLGELALSGRFQFLGREHEATLGVSYGESEATNREFTNSIYDSDLFGYIALPGFPYPGNAVAEPIWGGLAVYSVLNEELTRVFGATRLALTDRLKAVIGINYAKYHRDGVNYGVTFDQTEDNLSPYAGLTFDFNENILGYISYSDIYQPQDQSDADGRYLDPTKGVNYEVGVKAEWLDQRLLTTLAWFKAEQDNLATGAGYNANAQFYYTGVDVESTGYELEITGHVSEHVDLVFGYTSLKLDGLEGSDTYRWVPRRTANLLLNARLPSYTALSFGIGGRWQSSIANVESNGFKVRQESYAVIDGYIAWDFLPDATLQLNVRNLTDEKYINTLRFSGFYGAPRNATVSVNWRF